MTPFEFFLNHGICFECGSDYRNMPMSPEYYFVENNVAALCLACENDRYENGKALKLRAETLK